ncbi:uncharacterized protein LOC134528839 [Bacillus rossius redtenbacheri]|uniref:uncharacterized protein LOC134528839 n=1 Tax=Bacillus rossius redtenbacheri TaxID=93214 RepID=UPI002FDE83D9
MKASLQFCRPEIVQSRVRSPAPEIVERVVSRGPGRVSGADISGERVQTASLLASPGDRRASRQPRSRTCSWGRHQRRASADSEFARQPRRSSSESSAEVQDVYLGQTSAASECRQRVCSPAPEIVERVVSRGPGRVAGADISGERVQTASSLASPGDRRASRQPRSRTCSWGRHQRRASADSEFARQPRRSSSETSAEVQDVYLGQTSAASECRQRVRSPAPEIVERDVSRGPGRVSGADISGERVQTASSLASPGDRRARRQPRSRTCSWGRHQRRASADSEFARQPRRSSSETSAEVQDV